MKNRLARCWPRGSAADIRLSRREPREPRQQSSCPGGSTGELFRICSPEWRPASLDVGRDVGSPEQRRKDPGHIVIDEVAGQWITLAGATAISWRALLVGFVLFRLFDIWKPAPVRQLESLPEGTGIMADDMMAGVYGAVVLYLAGYFHLY